MKYASLAPLVVLMISLCGGCVADRKVAFNASQFTPYEGTGTSTVTGQAFLKTRGGDVKFGAGDKVMLIPVTDYTEEDYTRAVVNNENLKPPAASEMASIEEHTRTAIGDGSGNFEFTSLPAGSYFVECSIIWEVPAGYITVKSGGMAHARVMVRPGERVKVIATREN